VVLTHDAKIELVKAIAAHPTLVLGGDLNPLVGLPGPTLAGTGSIVRTSYGCYGLTACHVAQDGFGKYSGIAFSLKSGAPAERISMAHCQMWPTDIAVAKLRTAPVADGALPLVPEQLMEATRIADDQPKFFIGFPGEQSYDLSDGTYASGIPVFTRTTSSALAGFDPELHLAVR